MPGDSRHVDAPLEWELDVTDSRLLLGVAYVFPSVFGGVVLLVAGLLVALVALSILAGDVARALGLVGVAVFGLLSRRYLPAAFASDAADPFHGRFSRRGLAVGSVLGAAVLLASTRLHPEAPYGVFVASVLPLVLTAAFPTTGRADPAAGTLVVDGTEAPLHAVCGFRAVAVGPVAVCWLSYARGVPSAPRVVVLPTDVVGAVESIIERTSSAPAERGSTVDRSVRVVACLFGLALIAVGPALWYALPPGDARVIALYAGAMFGLFGAVFLWYAARA